MAQTLQNQITYAKSMNGIVSLSDGAGTTISNGTIDTDNLVVDNFTVINMLVNYMSILRDSNPVVNAALGSTVDIGLLVQNMIFDDINRLYQIWDDTATYKLFEVDVSNNTVTFNNSTVSFPNSTVTIDRTSTVALNTLLGSTFNLNTLCQNLNFNTTNRAFEIWNDSATGQIFEVNVTDANNYVALSTLNGVFRALTKLRLISPDLQLIDSNVSFPNSTITFNSNLPTSTVTPSADNQLITRIYADSRYAELATNNAFTSTNTFDSFLPTSIITTTTGGSQFITRAIGDGRFGQLAAANTWTGNTNKFDSFLPTSIITTTTGGTQFITRAIGDGRFGQLAAANTWTGNTNTFNSFLPTSSIATTTGGTQFITRAIGDGRFGQLAAANTWTLQNTFSTGILPRRATGDGTDIQLGGANQMQYRQATSQYNIGIGALTIQGDSNALGLVNNTGKRNIGIGDSALSTMDSGVDNIAIGYQAMQNCGSIRLYTVNSNRDIAIGTGAIKNGIYGVDNIVIGHYAMPNNTSGNNNTIIANYGGAGLTNNDCVIIGALSAPTLNDNGVISIGSECLGGATGSANGVTALGNRAGYFNTGGQRGSFFGYRAGYSNTTGSYNNCFGYLAGESSLATASFSTCIGAFSNYLEDNEFVIGGDNFSGSGERFPRLTLPNKTRLACNQSPTGATITLTFRTNENVILTDATTTTINLPTPLSTDLRNIGCKFNIVRSVTTTNYITINPPSGQTIGVNQIDGSIAAASSYIMHKGENHLSLLCVGQTGMTWMVINTSFANGSDFTLLSTTIPGPAISFGLSFSAITASSFNYYQQFSDPTNLYYQPSISTLFATNIASTNISSTNINGDDLTLTGAILLNTADIFYGGSNGNLIFGAGITLNTPSGNNLLFGKNGATIASANCYNNVCLSSAGCKMTGVCDDNVIIGSQNVDATSTINRNILIGTQIHYLTATTSTDNVFIGFRASTSNKDQTFSTAIGSTATVSNSLTYATAIGAGSVCTTSNTVQLGRTGDKTKCDTLESNKSSSTTFQYLTQNTLITAATTLTNPLLSYYPFTMKTAFGYTVTVPEITASNVGTQLVFKRIGGSLQILTLATSSNQPIFLGGNAVGVVGNSTIVSSTQSCCTLVATQTQDAGAGTFTNGASSAVITIVTQTSGTLSIGGIINCNGNVRYITSYVSGLGGLGTYTVNAVIVAANTGQPYTSSVTYGYGVVSDS